MNDFNLDFNSFNVIKPGTRYATNVPLFKTSTTYNRMELNAAAAALVGVKEDDRIIIIDNPNEKEDLNNIYYFIIHPKEGAKLAGDTRKAFSYSGPYAGMVIGNPTVHAGNDTDLDKAGLLVPGIKTKTALHIVEYKVVETGKTMVYEGEECYVFALRERTVVEVNRGEEDNADDPIMDDAGINAGIQTDVDSDNDSDNDFDREL